MSRALITGIAGQDGSYLAELLLTKGYEVHGTVLPSKLDDPQKSLSNLSGIRAEITLHPVNIEAYPSITDIVKKISPDECYHLAASSFVSYSFNDEFSIFNTNINGTHHILAAIKDYAKECRVYFAGSSEMFGQADCSPQNETTPFHPRSPYGITKATGFFLANYYRKCYGLFICGGIAFNHESPRRASEYVTRKITGTAARIKLGLENKLELGNLDAERDWGYAPDYVKGMWMMLQQSQPDDYVLATGLGHKVRDICKTTFSYLSLDYQDYVKVNPDYFRPESEIPLIGDSSKARSRLHWSPQKPFQDIITEMVDYDLELIQNLQ